MVNERAQESIPILGGSEKNSSEYGTVIPIYQPNKRSQTTTTNTAIGSDRLSYPKAVIFVLSSKFFEAFAANGVRTVLALYLRDSLNFSEESATSFYHIFNFFSQFCPIFGAVLADSYLGNVKTIFYVFFLYAIGWIGMVALTFPFQGLPMTTLVISSLILISIGNGSIRACVTSLGGSQFQMPEQSKQLDQYFSHYYFVYTMGIMLSKIIPPAIRAKTQCFGENDCYAAVFGALGAIFLMAWIIFLIGMCLYKHEEVDDADGNILFQVIGCIWYGIGRKLRGHRYCTATNNSWIDGAVGKYSESFVQDLSVFLKLLKLFIPLPIYWSLFAQIDSSWTFQAAQLNTTVFGYKFEADQAKAMGAILVLILIPLWQNLVVPLLLVFNIQIAPLRSIVIGGICAALSFVCAAILQLKIESNTNLLQTSNAQNLSILWQFPQFLMIMIGEVLLSIPGLTFSFTQAPPSMKSVMTAAWFCNNAFGNLIVVAITEWQPFTLQSNEYFLYASLMMIAILAFAWIAGSYRYTRYEDFTERNRDGNGGKYLSNNLSFSAPNVNYFKSQEGLDLIL